MTGKSATSIVQNGSGASTTVEAKGSCSFYNLGITQTSAGPGDTVSVDSTLVQTNMTIIQDGPGTVNIATTKPSVMYPVVLPVMVMGVTLIGQAGAAGTVTLGGRTTPANSPSGTPYNGTLYDFITGGLIIYTGKAGGGSVTATNTHGGFFVILLSGKSGSNTYTDGGGNASTSFPPGVLVGSHAY